MRPPIRPSLTPSFRTSKKHPVRRDLECSSVPCHGSSSFAPLYRKDDVAGFPNTQGMACLSRGLFMQIDQPYNKRVSPSHWMECACERDICGGSDGSQRLQSCVAFILTVTVDPSGETQRLSIKSCLSIYRCIRALCCGIAVMLYLMESTATDAPSRYDNRRTSLLLLWAFSGCRAAFGSSMGQIKAAVAAAR